METNRATPKYTYANHSGGYLLKNKAFAAALVKSRVVPIEKACPQSLPTRGSSSGAMLSDCLIHENNFIFNCQIGKIGILYFFSLHTNGKCTTNCKNCQSKS